MNPRDSRERPLFGKVREVGDGPGPHLFLIAGACGISNRPAMECLDHSRILRSGGTPAAEAESVGKLAHFHRSDAVIRPQEPGRRGRGDKGRAVYLIIIGGDDHGAIDLPKDGNMIDRPPLPIHDREGKSDLWSRERGNLSSQ